MTLRETLMDPYLAKLIRPPKAIEPKELLWKCVRGERVLLLIKGILSAEQHAALVVEMRGIRESQRSAVHNAVQGAVQDAARDAARCAKRVTP